MERPYRTLRRELRHEIDKIKGSRFVATAGPFGDEATLADRIRELRAELPEATHHCHAWRHGQRFRWADDGEPSGTAGRPILQQIASRRLDRVFVVVSRIFGGTKLGAGGLVRAYAAAAGSALERAEIVEVVPTRAVHVTIPYALAGTLEAIAHASRHREVGSDFGQQVRRTFAVPGPDVADFVAEVLERTSGRARVTIDDDAQEQD